MSLLVVLTVSPEASADEGIILRQCAKLAGYSPGDIAALRIIKKSVDARQKSIKVNLTVEVIKHGEDSLTMVQPFQPVDVSLAREVIIIGAGPAGLFAALRLTELGLRPVIIERGKLVQARKIDIARIGREQIINTESNYCFGEGGAGTYSDGKLFSRSRKRGDNRRVLELFCYHGANPEILYEAHPHIGSDKLPSIISGIRESIVNAGGVFITEKKITDIIIEGQAVKGVVDSDNGKYLSSDIILATGHSARDIYDICRRRNITYTFKPFAAGVRVEHPQELIDRIRYHGSTRGNFLPAASYSLVCQADGKGVFSFCMCPGGFIIPSATSQEEVVVNGMSPSARNSPYANSGIVCEISPDYLKAFSGYGETAGLEFQKDLEHKAWEQGGCTQRAPAQRLTDFIAGKMSGSLPGVSYFPGVTPSPMHSWLPGTMVKRLREGFMHFGTVMKGFVTDQAVILGVESRTSSPVRILRNDKKLEHISIAGLYPCGEGSGYSGGIVSSAVDGMRVAEAIARKYAS